MSVSLLDARLLLRRLGEQVTSRAVLVGGQAVAMWAAAFDEQLPPTLRADALASQDTDFCSDLATVRVAAQQLHGKLKTPSMDDANTPSIGVVTYLDPRGEERWVDFIDQPHGLRQVDLMKRAQTLEVLDEAGAPTGQTFRVLHPLDVLRSRVWNTGGLPGYQNEHALRQVRAAIACVNAFARLILNAGTVDDKAAHRAVLRINEEVFELSSAPYGLDVFFKFGIDVSEGVLDDPRLPEKFRAVRLPQLRVDLAELRQRKTPKPPKP